MSEGLLYYSETGNTEFIAHAIADSLGFTAEVNLREGWTDTFTAFDRLFFGMPVHGNNIPDRVRILFTDGKLSGKAVSFFYTHTGLMDDETTTGFEGNLRYLCSQCDVRIVGSLWHCRGENRRSDIREWIQKNMPHKYPSVLSAVGLPVLSDGKAAVEWARVILEKKGEQL